MIDCFLCGNSSTLDDSIHVSLTSSTSHNNGNTPSIILGNTKVSEDLNTGCPALEYNKDYLVSCGIELELAGDIEHKNQIFGSKAGLGNYDQIT